MKPSKVFNREQSLECEYLALSELWSSCEAHLRNWNAMAARGTVISADAMIALVTLQTDIRQRARWVLHRLDNVLPYNDLGCPPPPLPDGWGGWN